VPSRREIQWSQLKVGALVLAATAILIGLLFLMTGATGGLFARKIVLRSYFPNAAGIKEGSPVTLEGVTIGNVTRMRVVPERNPQPVELIMQVSERFLRDLHTDSTASIGTAGVLGDSYVDIDSTHAHGPTPLNDAELATSGAPTIQSVISSSQVGIEDLSSLIRKMETLVDTLNTTRGTAGELINDPGMKKNIVSIAANLQTVTEAMTQDKGTLGELLNDNTLYTKLNTAIDQVNTLTADLNSGKGTAGKLLKDEALYDNLNTAVTNLNQIAETINSGKGSIGKLMKDPDVARKLDDTVTNLDNLLKGINAGEGSAGQFVKNRSFYDHLDGTMDQAQQLVKSMRQDPKKYLVIQLKLF
jgi:phospholipid/cholesterol/gamma-HCH transport system substrate-binding protein